MKSALVLLIVALIAATSAVPAPGLGGPWIGGVAQGNDQLYNPIPSFVSCVNVRCRMSCLQSGAVSGYCALGTCNCVIPGPRYGPLY